MAENTSSSEQAEAKRERSTIEFPYLDQDDAIEIVTTIHANFGTSCQREQLAAQLQVSATGGGFNLRLGTAKMYGLINNERGTITLTDLGQRVADAQQEKSARVQSFLNIPLYKAMFEKFNGKTLPPTSSGLEAEMVTLGVAPKQKDRARQVFQRSAKEAGFFWSGNDRLVMPATGRALLTKNPASGSPPQPERQQPQHIAPEYPAFIQGLLMKLPKEGTEWKVDEKKKWLQAAALIFDMLYPDPETTGSWNVEFDPKV